MKKKKNSHKKKEKEKDGEEGIVEKKRWKKRNLKYLGTE